eukprot:5909851-Prymnesium_polylepis.1
MPHYIVCEQASDSHAATRTQAAAPPFGTSGAASSACSLRSVEVVAGWHMTCADTRRRRRSSGRRETYKGTWLELKW